MRDFGVHSYCRPALRWLVGFDKQEFLVLNVPTGPHIATWAATYSSKALPHDPFAGEPSCAHECVYVGLQLNPCKDACLRRITQHCRWQASCGAGNGCKSLLSPLQACVSCPGSVCASVNNCACSTTTAAWPAAARLTLHPSCCCVWRPVCLGGCTDLVASHDQSRRQLAGGATAHKASAFGKVQVWSMRLA